MVELEEYQVSNGLGRHDILVAALRVGLTLLRPEEIDWFECDFIRDDMVRWPAVAVEAAERLQDVSSRRRNDGYQQIRFTRGITADVLSDLAEVAPYSISGQVWAYGQPEVADFSDDAGMVAFRFEALPKAGFRRVGGSVRGRRRGLPMMGVLTPPIGKTSTCPTLPLLRASPALI